MSAANVNTNFYPNSAQPSVEHSSTYCTRAKMERIALYTFAAIAAAAGAALIVASASSLIAWPIGFVSIPLFAISFALARTGFKIKDYENPKELKSFQNEAAFLTFDQLVETHGLENVCKRTILTQPQLKEKFLLATQSHNFSQIKEKYTLTAIFTYELMDVSTLRSKFLEEIKPLSLEEFCAKFPRLEVLNQYQILKDLEHDALCKIRKDFNDAHKACSSKCEQIDLKYPQRQRKLIEQLQQKKLDAATRAEQRREGLITRLTSFPPGASIKSDLDNELARIDQQISDIQTKGIGFHDQLLYHGDLASARTKLNVELAAIDRSFQGIITSSTTYSPVTN